MKIFAGPGRGMLIVVARRVQPGDVYEYDLGGSFAYLQYVERRQPLGSLVRVLELRAETRPERPVLLTAVKSRARFLVFVDVAGGARSGALQYVTTCGVPPLGSEDRWRNPALRDEANRAISWLVWDGARGERRHVHELLPADRSRSVASLVSLTLLRRALVTEWAPENDIGRPFHGPLSYDEPTAATSRPNIPVGEHAFVFGARCDAERFRHAAAERGHEADARQTQGGWVVIVMMPTTIEAGTPIPDELVELAAAAGGVYDGGGVWLA